MGTGQHGSVPGTVEHAFTANLRQPFLANGMLGPCSMTAADYRVQRRVKRQIHYELSDQRDQSAEGHAFVDHVTNSIEITEKVDN